MPLQPPDAIENTAQASVTLAERFLNRGEPLLAFDAVQAGLKNWPGHGRLRQLQALALARSGDVERANRILGRLVAEGVADAETLAILARTHKDLALRSTEASRRAEHLRAGFRLYEQAFASAQRESVADDAYYAGINAAAMAVLLGNLECGRRLARDVREICRRADAAGESATSRYWREATLGEAALILGEPESAATHYASAARLAGGHSGNLSSSRRQARLLAAHLPGADCGVAEVLRIAPVLVATGNMIDRPDRPAPRFPPALEPQVRVAMRERLAAIAPLAVYGSAACGADILCLELVRELGGETHVVLPYPPAEFRRASVDFAPGDWGGRFDRALATADSVTITSDHLASGSAATFEYANLVVTGMGKLRAQGLDTPLRGLAVWDPAAVGASGGSASLVALWDARGIAVDHVHLRGLRREPATTAQPVSQAALNARNPHGIRHEMRAMLFADAVGYSQLSEDQIPQYISGFLGAVGELSRRTAHRFEHVETSGDGLYMVFATVADAARYALELSAMTSGFDRAACGLPESFDLRIALHCGPVHCGTDPITGGRIYTGPHASRAAHIEAITPPGQVFASNAFAAVAAASGVDGLVLHYVGRIPLAKGHGTLGLYHVRSG